MRSSLAKAIQALVDQPVVVPGAITQVDGGGHAILSLDDNQTGRVAGSASDAPIRTSEQALALKTRDKGRYVLVSW
jgi:hypothetical protein